VNDAHPWKLYTPPDILVCRQCVDVMYVIHSIRRTDRDNAERTAVDIKAHTPLIRFVVDLLYNKLWTCRGCCGYVVDLLLVCCT